MSVDLRGYGLNTEEDLKDGERPDNSPVPSGEYTVAVVKSGSRTTSSGGTSVWVQLKVQDGEQKGRTVLVSFNLVNQSQKAQAIAKRQFAELCCAVGVKDPSSTEELFNLPFRVKLGLEPDGRGNYRNCVEDYFVHQHKGELVRKDRGGPAPTEFDDSDDIPF